MQDLLETLARELERPREISSQVARHLTAHYSISDDQIGPFLENTLPTLEEDEIDLILSPLFTPKLADQAVFASLLGQLSVPVEEQTHLIARAVARPTDARLIVDGDTRRVGLSEVTIERFVYRLRLEGTVPDPIFEVIQRFSPDYRSTLQAVARRQIWESYGRYGILESYLTATANVGEFGLEEVRSLLDLVERYKPADFGDLSRKIPQWREGLQGDLGLSGGRPFFSRWIEQSHGGERDHRSAENTLVEAKRRELAFLERLELLLVG